MIYTEKHILIIIYLMKKYILILAALMISLPMMAQKLSKEEKAARAKAAYEAAVQSINDRAWVLVPSSYTASDGMIENNINNDNFLSCEGKNLFAQGSIVCDNKYTNLLEDSEYTVNVDKKGNVKMRIIVTGRMMKGTYSITMRGNNNVADVIFSQSTGSTLRFTGPIVPLKGASYNKRSNPM